MWLRENGYCGGIVPDRADVTLHGALVELNAPGGVFISGAEATVARATRRAQDGQTFGDGILARSLDEKEPSRVTIITTALTDNMRLGIRYVGSAGEPSSARSWSNRFGLVVQPGPTGTNPTLGEGNVFES